MNKIKELLKYPTTREGIIAVLTAALCAAFPEYKIQIAEAGLTLFGAHKAKFSDVDVK